MQQWQCLPASVDHFTVYFYTDFICTSDFFLNESFFYLPTCTDRQLKRQIVNVLKIKKRFYCIQQNDEMIKKIIDESAYLFNTIQSTLVQYPINEH